MARNTPAGSSAPALRARANTAGGVAAGALLALALLVSACGDDDDRAEVTLDGSVSPTGASTDGGVTPSPAPVGSSGKPPLFVVASGVDETTFIKTVPALDVDQKLEFSQSLEAKGFGDIALVGGKLYVSEADSPIVRRFVITDSGSFQPDGDINFGVHTKSADIYNQTFVSPTKAYLTTDTKKWAVWNPTTMQIVKTVDFPASLGPREGLEPHYSFDRGFVTRGNRVFQAVSFSDVTNHKMAATSAIVVLDADTDAVLDVLDAPCPFLDVATFDDAGNLFYSGWVYSPGATLINGGAKSCAVKIPAGSSTIDPTATLQMAQITGGHEASAFTYIGNNKFLFSVFHEEKKPFNQATDMISDWIFSDSWRYATYDIVTKEYKELENFGWQSGGFYSSRIDGRFFLLTPGAGYDSTTIQELLPDGTAKTGLKIDGWATRAYKVH